MADEKKYPFDRTVKWRGKAIAQSIQNLNEAIATYGTEKDSGLTLEQIIQQVRALRADMIWFQRLIENAQENYATLGKLAEKMLEKQKQDGMVAGEPVRPTDESVDY